MHKSKRLYPENKVTSNPKLQLLTCEDVAAAFFQPGWTDEGPNIRKGNDQDWGGVEVGYWNDVAQESSSWTSAPTWKSGKGMMVKVYIVNVYIVSCSFVPYQIQGASSLAVLEHHLVALCVVCVM